MALNDIRMTLTADGASNTADGLNNVGDATKRLATTTQSATGAMAGAWQKLVTAMAAWKVLDYIRDSALMAAKYETLGVVMTTVGNNAGYTSKQMNAFQLSLQKQGIAMVESRQTLTQMASAHMDLSKSSELARIAQDAAVIGQMNSSEAFNNMITGIQRGEVEIMKTLGLNVDFAGSQATLAAQLGKTTTSLTQTEKVQANMNATMLKGKDIAGVYDAAMGTAGKQLSSMQRYMDNLKVVAGSVFNDLLITGVQAFTGGLKAANSEAERLQQAGQLKDWGKYMVLSVATIADGLYIVYASLNTLVTAGVAGFMQLYYGAKSFGQALLLDFSGAKESFNDMMATGQTWVDMTNKQWAGATKYQDSARQMYAERDAEVTQLANKEKAAALEKSQLAAGASNQATELAQQHESLIAKNREAWGKIVIDQLESVGVYEKATKMAIELNQQTDAYKGLLDAAKYSKEAQAALDAQAILNTQKIVEAEKKSLELVLAKKNASSSAMQQLIQLTAANGGDVQALQATQLRMEYEKKSYEYAVQLADARMNENDIAASITEQNQAQLDILYSQSNLSEDKLNSLRGVLGLEQSITSEKQRQSSASSHSSSTSSTGSGTGAGSSWGWDADGNIIGGSSSLSSGGGSPGTREGYTGYRDGRWFVNGLPDESLGANGVGNFSNSTPGGQMTPYRGYDPTGVVELTPTQKASNEKFKAAADAAASAAESVAQSMLAQAEATLKAHAALQQDLDVRALILTGTSDEVALLKTRISQQNELAKAQQDGLDTSRLVAIQQAEYNKLLHGQQLTKVIKDTETFFTKIKTAISDLTSSGNSLVTSLQSAAASLRKASGDLLTGSNTNLSPEAQYAQSRTDLAATVQQAMSSGDAALYSQIPSLISAFLDQSKGYNASGAGYQSDFAWAQNLLDTSATAADIAATNAGAVITAAQLQQATLDKIKEALTTDNTAALPKLFAELSSGSGRLNTAVAATNAALASSGAIATGLTGVNSSVAGGNAQNVSWLTNVYNATGTVSSNVVAGKDSTAAWLNNVNTSTASVNSSVAGVSAQTAYLPAYLPNMNALADATKNYTVAYSPYLPELSTIRANSGKLKSATSTHWALSATYYGENLNYTYYKKGGIANDPTGRSIFGEAGPEAAVPLPDGRSIPVTLSGWAAADNRELIAEIKELRKEVAELKGVNNTGNRIAAAGFSGVIEVSEKQARSSESQANSARLVA